MCQKELIFTLYLPPKRKKDGNNADERNYQYSMKKHLAIIFVVLLCAGCTSVRKDWLAVCGDGVVRIIDMAESDSTNIKEMWRWDKDDPQANLPNGYDLNMRNLDECKFVDNNTKMLLTASGNGMMLIDIETKAILCYAHVPMAHSADLLPGNRIAVALSTHKKGNALEIYDIDTPEKVVFRDSLYSGHGVVWNEKRQRLYALGYKELREYELADWKTDRPSLRQVRMWEIPMTSGHDLSPVDENRMLVSAHEGVMWFDIGKEQFSPFEPLRNVENVKSVNYDPKTGKLVYTKAEVKWWTHHIYQENPDKVVTMDSLNVYKVRVMK